MLNRYRAMSLWELQEELRLIVSEIKARNWTDIDQLAEMIRTYGNRSAAEHDD